MNITTDNLRDAVEKAFLDIVTDGAYCESRWKRYRVFVFSYIFGCIHYTDMFYLFPEESHFSSPKRIPDAVNAHNAALNYLASKKYLKRLKDGYYCLDTEGIKKLYERLGKCGYVSDISFDVFAASCKKRELYSSHASKSGRLVLSFINSPVKRFLYEPFLDNKGNIVNKIFARSMPIFIIPDAVIHSASSDEVYFIEADSCKERLNTVLVPKFSVYADFMENGASLPSSTTIHFSVWNDFNENVCSIVDPYEYTNIVTLYAFFKTFSGQDLSFSSYIDALLSYSGENENIARASRFLINEGVESASSEKELFLKLEHMGIQKIYTKQFIARRKQIEHCIAVTPKLKNSLLLGARLVCLPFHSYNRLYEFVYLEDDAVLGKTKKFIERTFCGHTILRYDPVASFADDVTGECFYFRNMFTLGGSDGLIHVCIENITDDLSGNLRVKKYANFPRKIHSKNFYIYCLYNDFSTEISNVFNTNKEEIEQNIFFVSYSEFSM